MGKNRKFKNSYLVTIEGTTTNGFQAELFHNLVRAIGTAFSVNSQQCSVSSKVISTEGDFDAELGKIKQEEK